MKPVILFLIFALFLSCKPKVDVIYIDGQIIDSVQSISLSNVNVSLSAKLIEYGVWSNTYTELLSAESDQYGIFNIEFDERNAESYKIYIKKDNYFPFVKEFNSEDFESQNNRLQLLCMMTPEGYLRLHIKNTSPVNSSDNFSYKFINPVVNSSECCNGEPNYFIGMTVDTVVTCKAVGGNALTIEYNVKKGQFYNTYTAQIDIAVADTTDFSINY